MKNITVVWVVAAALMMSACGSSEKPASATAVEREKARDVVIAPYNDEIPMPGKNGLELKGNKAKR